MAIQKTPLEIVRSKEVNIDTIPQVDAILFSLTKDRFDCYNNRVLIDFWLVVRYDLLSEGSEE